jgi:uncharacterized protein
MKYLIVLLVVAVGLWLWLGGRRRGRVAPPAAQAPRQERNTGAAPQAMLACAHCGVHLPAADVVADAAGRAFCSDAHRLAGPR